VATRANLNIDQGSWIVLPIEVTVTWLNDFTGFTASGKIRDARIDGTVLVDLDSYLDFDTTSGVVTLDIGSDVTADWFWDRGYYELVITDGTPAHDVTFLKGEIRVDREVTA
jgi:hypothetical protein